MPEMQQRASLLSSTAANTPPSDPQVEVQAPASIPPWVHIQDGNTVDPNAQRLVSPPANTIPNTRHFKPPPPHYRPGRKWDHLRSSEPPLLSMPIADHQTRWRPFMASGPNEDWQDAGARVVSQAWMDEHMPVLSRGWDPEDELEVDGHHQAAKGFTGLMYKGKWLISPERQERTVRLFWRLLLKNPFMPLAFRLTILAFTAASLGLAGTIMVAVDHVNHDADADNQCSSRASTIMAICVSTIAIPYLGYITWDEYMSKPLGMRSVIARVLLLLVDLYFIVFSASNLSLAFDALFDHRWACYDYQYSIAGSDGGAVPATCPNNPGICYHQKALTSVLFVGLCAWLLTFSLSVMRVVEKLRPD